MRRVLGIVACMAILLTASKAHGQQAAATADVTAAPTTSAAAPAPAVPNAAAHGRWVYTSTYGWIWVPDGAAPVAVEGVPYVYLYTPSYGWTWYVSPWGWGPFSVGSWVWRPWRPPVWHGWVAPPHVVVRLHPFARRW